MHLQGAISTKNHHCGIKIEFLNFFEHTIVSSMFQLTNMVILAIAEVRMIEKKSLQVLRTHAAERYSL